MGTLEAKNIFCLLTLSTQILHLTLELFCVSKVNNTPAEHNKNTLNIWNILLAKSFLFNNFKYLKEYT